MALPITQPQAIPEEKPAKSKIEIMAEIKKLFEKNNIVCDDEKILTFFNSISSGEGYKKDFTVKLSKDKKQIIKVFPLGKVFVEKYNDYFEFTNIFFDEIINNFNNTKLFKPYGDENHELGVKYFEILDLEKKEDGLYAQIELNDLGIQAIKNNRYSYISPEWGSRVDTDGTKYENVLWAITLTNIPALEGLNPTLQDQIKLNKKEAKMDFKLSLANLEGRIANKRLAEDPQNMLPPEILDALAIIKEAIAKIDELTQGKQVAEEQAQAAQAQAAVLMTEKSEKEKQDFFDNAVSKGKIEIKELELMKANYDKSKEFIITLVNARPEKSSNQLTSTKINKDVDLTDEDYFVMEKNGLDKNKPEDVKRYKMIIRG